MSTYDRRLLPAIVLMAAIVSTSHCVLAHAALSECSRPPPSLGRYFISAQI